MKNSDYWVQRFGILEQESHNSAKRTVDKITPHFDRAQRDIEKEIESWYQRFAKNNGVDMAEAKKMLNAKELKELKWDVDEYIKYGRENALDGRWMKELENASARYHISRLEALELRSRQAAESAFAKEDSLLTEHLRDTYEEQFLHTAFETQKGIGVGWELGGIDERKLDRLLSQPWTADGKTFSDRIWTSKAQLLDSVSKELTHMCILGKAPDEAIKNIAERMNVSKHQAGRLVMTESAFISSAAQQACFKELGVEQYEIVATLDSHTSEICRELDGKVQDMKDYKVGVTAPPFHVFCRSTTVPYFDDEFTEGETRAARDPDTGKTYYVPSDMTYKEWKEIFVDKTKEMSDILKNNWGSKIKTGEMPPRFKDFHSLIDFNRARNEYDGSLKYMEASKTLWKGDYAYDEGEIENIKRFEVTIAQLQADYPLMEEYETYVGDYDKVQDLLTDKQRSGIDGEASAQQWFNDKNNIIGFTPASAINTLEEDLIIRKEHIQKRENLYRIFENSPEGMAVHEYGHAVSDYLSEAMVYQNEDAIDYWEWYKTLTKEEITEGLSEYAATNRWEFEAECFSELMTNNPRPLAVKYGQFLRKIMENPLAIPKADAIMGVDDIVTKLIQKDLEKQSSKSIKRGIISYEKKILEHKLKIEHPSEYVEEWNNYSEAAQKGLIRHWEKEVHNFEESINNSYNELSKRGEKF